MNSYNAIVDYDELVARLQQLCQHRVTGTAFIKSDSDNLARFIIVDGIMSSCVYRHKSGYDAIPLLRRIRSGTFRFSELPVAGMSFPPMPGNDEFFQLLTGKRIDDEEGSCLPEAGRRSAAPTPAQLDNDRALVAIKKVLRNYIGPMADIVCNHYIENKSDLLEPSRYPELIDMLAENIGNETERSAFRQAALARIRQD